MSHCQHFHQYITRCWRLRRAYFLCSSTLRSFKRPCMLSQVTLPILSVHIVKFIIFSVKLNFTKYFDVFNELVFISKTFLLYWMCYCPDVNMWISENSDRSCFLRTHVPSSIDRAGRASEKTAGVITSSHCFHWLPCTFQRPWVLTG